MAALLFEHMGSPQPQPRRLVDVAFDEMMRILMTKYAHNFERAELKKLLGGMYLPSPRSLNEAFCIPVKDERGSR